MFMFNQYDHASDLVHCVEDSFSEMIRFSVGLRRSAGIDRRDGWCVHHFNVGNRPCTYSASARDSSDALDCLESDMSDAHKRRRVAKSIKINLLVVHHFLEPASLQRTQARAPLGVSNR